MLTRKGRLSIIGPIALLIANPLHAAPVPSQMEIDGVPYQRLTGSSLKEALIGYSFWQIGCGVPQPCVEDFKANGETYAVRGDAVPVYEGDSTFLNDRVCISVYFGATPSKQCRAFFMSSKGEFASLDIANLKARSARYIRKAGPALPSYRLPKHLRGSSGFDPSQWCGNSVRPCTSPPQP